MIAKPHIALALVTCLSGSGCLTAMEKWHRTADPQAIGQAVFFGDTALALGAAHLRDSGEDSAALYWWLGIVCVDVAITLYVTLSSLD